MHKLILIHRIPSNLLPLFFISGIGIDDMFVIIASWGNLSHEQKQFQVREQAGLALKQAVSNEYWLIPDIRGASLQKACISSHFSAQNNSSFLH